MSVSLTAERLREVLSYDADTGLFAWRVRPCNSVKVGEVAGGPNQDGYIRTRVDGKRFMAHRLAWLYVHGEWPRAEIDHINGAKADNRIANLREATRRENNENQRRARSNNKLGLLGVSKHRDKFKAEICVDGRKTHIGRFKTAELAHAAYLAAKARLHGFQTLVAAMPHKTTHEHVQVPNSAVQWTRWPNVKPRSVPAREQRSGPRSESYFARLAE